jgi:hypothetical protein
MRWVQAAINVLFALALGAWLALVTAHVLGRLALAMSAVPVMDPGEKKVRPRLEPKRASRGIGC